MEILVLCGIYLVELVCYQLGLKVLFDAKCKTKVWMGVGVIMAFIIGILPMEEEGKNVLITTTVIIVVFLSLEGHNREKATRLVFVFLLLVCIEDVFMPIKKKVFEFQQGHLKNFDYLVSKCCVIGVIWCLRKIKDRKNGDKRIHISSIIYFIIGIIAVSMMFCLAVLNGAKQFFVTNDKYLLMCDILNISIHISIFLLLVFVVYIKSTHERMENLLKAEKVLKESQVNYYKQMLKKESDTRKYRHDMVNHLVYIQALLSKNKYCDTERYLANVIGGFHKIQRTYYIIGNEMIETIMNYYFGMLPEDVEIIIQGKCPVELALEETDICTIFSNLFQNIVEEIVENQIENAKIVISVKKGVQYVEYDIKNSLSVEIDRKHIEKNGLPRTHKVDKRNHGIGIVNIKSVVEKNRGKFNWYQENGYFGIDIILPVNF